MIRTVIVDDHRLFSEGLRTLLQTDEGIEVVAIYSNGKEFLKQLEEIKPDIVLMDIDMPEMNGFETAAKARILYPELRIILLSMHNDYASIDEGLKLGIRGYLPKNVDREELLAALEAVMENEDYFSSEITQTLVKGHRSKNMQQPIKLTPREIDILRLIVEELSTHEIAEKLFISTNTVETHRKNLMAKTGSKNSVGLVKFAMENKLV